MNANEFFEKYSIEIINKKTRISPISLRFIKNKEFEKIPRVKFIGFVRIIEKEFGIDLSELIEEYNNLTDYTSEEKLNYSEPKKHNTFILFVMALILLFLGAYLLYKNYKATPKHTKKIKQTFVLESKNDTTNKKYSITTTTEDNKTLKISSQDIHKEQMFDSNKTIKQNKIQKTKEKKLIPIRINEINIFPDEKVWFRAKNIDTNKTVEFLTVNPKTLDGANWYIKFGHGYITVKYGNETITPNTKKIVRILFKNGKYEYLKPHNRYEK
jgi:hypothetical protein